MSTATLLTLEQFEQLPHEDGVKYELKDGELVRMANAKAGHERTKFRIERSLMAYILQHPIGEIYSESSFALSPSRVCADTQTTAGSIRISAFRLPTTTIRSTWASGICA